MTTESVLKDWRFGQTQAERLVSTLLHIEGFESVDPQHPLGGPDGAKDLLCRKGRKLWVAAAYFPTTGPSFNEIVEKYKSDFEGVAGNRADAFAFFCNQHLTIGQRKQLLDHVGRVPVEIYHLERMRSILDSPKGCGARLEYLRIPMSEAEQWSFWSSMNQDIVRRLRAHEAQRNDQFSSLEQKMELVLARTNSIGYALAEQRSHLQHRSVLEFEFPTSSLSIGMVCWVHRIVTEGGSLPDASRGQIRGVAVWVGAADSAPGTARFTPVPPDQIEGQAESLFAWWRDQFSSLQTSSREDVVAALAELHHGLLKIHPFLDANGRVARTILDQASRELLSQSIGPELTGVPDVYYEALRKADGGDLSLLIEQISASLQ